MHCGDTKPCYVEDAIHDKPSIYLLSLSGIGALFYIHGTIHILHQHKSRVDKFAASSLRKYPLHRYILGVLRHTTAWDRHWGGDETLKLVSVFVAWLLLS